MKNYQNFVKYIENLTANYSGTAEHHTSAQYKEITDYAFKCADESPHRIFYDEAWELVGMIRFENYELFEDCNNAIYNNRASNGRLYCHMDDAIVDLAKEIIRWSVFRSLSKRLFNEAKGA
jgi:hypothetical protein